MPVSAMLLFDEQPRFLR